MDGRTPSSPDFAPFAEQLAGLSLPVCAFDHQGRCLLWNREITRWLGWNAGQLAGPSPLALLFPDPAARRAVKKVLGRRPAAGFHQWSPRDSQGRSCPGLWTLLELPGVRLFIGQDLRRRQLVETQLGLAARILDNIDVGILITDARRRILLANPAVCQITGYEAAELLGRTPALLASGRHPDSFYREMWRSLEQQRRWRGEVWNRRKGGDIYPQLLAISALCDEQGRVGHYLALFSDISQLRAENAELEHIAQYDALTGIPNRRLLADRLVQAMARTHRHGTRLAVCYLDLDGFKQVNDQYGHPAGDRLLIEISRRLKQILRPYDTLARLGGDEFVLLFADLPPGDDLASVMPRVLATVAEPVRLDEGQARVSASIGVTFYPDDEVEADLLLQHADQAMYLAKQGGKNRYRCYDSAQQQHQHARQLQLQQLEQALLLHQFRLYYQPKVDLHNGDLVGLEALLRWQHPQQGLLVPGAFLSQLNGTRFESQLGRWVLEQVLHQLDLWQHQGLVLEVSLNIGADHLLQADFADQLEQALARHPAVAPGRLELEVQEVAALHHPQQAALVLERCHRLGVRIALDDFGTGLSALSFLRSLPLDLLKLDHSLISDMLTNSDDLSLVSSMLHLAHSVHRPVLAEGVESPELAALLLRLGCRFAQGYGIAEPMPAERIPDWIRGWQGNALWVDLKDRFAGG